MRWPVTTRARSTVFTPSITPYGQSEMYPVNKTSNYQFVEKGDNSKPAKKKKLPLGNVRVSVLPWVLKPKVELRFELCGFINS